MLASVGIAVVVLFANLVVPHRVRLIGVAVLLIPQLYLPGLPASLAVLWTLMTCVAGLTARGRSRADSPLVVIFGLLVALTAVSLLWARPSGIHFGLITIVFGVVFLLWLREVIVLARDDSRLLDTIVLWTVPGVAVQSVLAISFQLSPAIEERFLRSGLAAITVGPAAAALVHRPPEQRDRAEQVRRVFRKRKCRIAVRWCRSACLCVCRAPHHAPLALRVCGLVFRRGGLHRFEVGSHHRHRLCDRDPVSAAHAQGFSRAHRPPNRALDAAGLLSADRVCRARCTHVLRRLRLQLRRRERLWTRAAQMFQESPLLGPGFGGWVERIGRIGSRSDLPPHNILIATWAYSGIVAAVLAVVFMVAAIAFGLRVAAAQPTVRDRRTAAFALCAIVWVFLHGMGDNTTLLRRQTEHDLGRHRLRIPICDGGRQAAANLPRWSVTKYVAAQPFRWKRRALTAAGIIVVRHHREPHQPVAGP